MAFTRSIAPSSQRLEGRAVTPGREQQVIWAYASGSQTGLSYHGGKRGGLFIDFATGATGEISLEGQASLYIHLVLMILACGIVLPSGVALAKCLRRAPNGNSGSLVLLALEVPGFWQPADVAGLGRSHLVHGAPLNSLPPGSLHRAPLWGACRPHKQEIITSARRAFELGHEGLGYAALLLVTALATTLAVMFMFPVLAYIAFSAVMPHNAPSRMLLGVPGDVRQEMGDRKTNGAAQ